MNLPALKPAQRRRYTPEFKQQLVAQCQPEVSVSGVALAHGINANLLRRWIRKRSSGSLPIPVASTTRLVPVAVQPDPLGDSMIEISITRKGSTMSLRWPVSAADALSGMLADWAK